MDVPAIGKTVRDARKAARLSQADVAQAAGVSRVTISQLENGNISDLGVKKLMAVLASLDLKLMIAARVPSEVLEDSLTFQKQKFG